MSSFRRQPQCQDWYSRFSFLKCRKATANSTSAYDARERGDQNTHENDVIGTFVGEHWHQELHRDDNRNEREDRP